MPSDSRSFLPRGIATLSLLTIASGLLGSPVKEGTPGTLDSPVREGSPDATGEEGLADWPQFLGPTRDGVYRGAASDIASLESDPPVLWSVDVGQGYAGPIVARGKLIQFHRRGDKETVQCLNAETGSEIWAHDYPTAYYDSYDDDHGPQATPTIDGDSVYAFGTEGVLSALSMRDGKPRWSVATHDRYRVRETYFGTSCSPIVEKDRVIVAVGGQPDAGIVAFDSKTGDEVWKATDHAAGYSSPTIATIDGDRHALFLTRHGVVDLDPIDGTVRFLFRYRARSATTVNAATPLIVRGKVFVSASYGTGAKVFGIRKTADGRFEPEDVWSGDGSLSNHYGTSVVRGGELYGFHGRQERGADLRCVDAATGRVRWSEDRFGSGSLLRAGDRILALDDTGRLTVFRASPERFERLASARLFRGSVRAYPALARGRLYARDGSKLVAFDLRGGRSTTKEEASPVAPPSR